MEQQRVFGDFHSILSETGTWKIGGFPLPDGSFWEYREPNAVVIVRNGILYVRAPLSRQNDQIQILDNAKHMYYSNEEVDVPESGEVTFELQIRARTQGTVPGDLYDGYVSLNLLDFSTGAALDFCFERQVCQRVCRSAVPGRAGAGIGQDPLLLHFQRGRYAFYTAGIQHVQNYV